MITVFEQLKTSLSYYFCNSILLKLILKKLFHLIYWQHSSFYKTEPCLGSSLISLYSTYVEDSSSYLSCAMKSNVKYTNFISDVNSELTAKDQIAQLLSFEMKRYFFPPYFLKFWQSHFRNAELEAFCHLHSWFPIILLETQHFSPLLLPSLYFDTTTWSSALCHSPFYSS